MGVDAAGRPSSRGGRAAGGRVELGVLAEDALLERAELGRRLEPELVEGRPRVAVRGERVGLTAGAVEGEHLLRPEALTMRVLRDERLELGGDLGRDARLEIGVDPRLERGEPPLLEPRRLRLGERLECDVGERVPAPERERLDRLPVVHELLEALGVELAVLDAQEIPRRPRDDPVGAERAPQRVDVDLERVLCARRGRRHPRSPSISVSVETAWLGWRRSVREQRPRPRATERDLGPVVAADLQRAEQPELHASGSSRNVLSIGRPVERAETVECELRCRVLPQHQARARSGHVPRRRA